MHTLTAADIQAAYTQRQLSPVELVRGLLARIEALDADYSAFIRVDAQAALNAATLAEQEIFQGRVRGPLHGIPVGIKDNIDVTGCITTCHSKRFVDRTATSDAPVIQSLRAAGAILIGKLALHEFAIGGPSFELPFPPARNPWNADYFTGGSSSGSGAALAAGFVPLAVGTDTGGSIRNPAGACGVVGLKPTYDLISRDGVFPLSFSLDHVGPMGRSVEDVAAMLDALAGRPGNRPFSSDIERGVRGMRVGFVRHFHEGDETADPEVASALEQAAQLLREEGAIVSDVRLPSLREMQSASCMILFPEAWRIHAKALREQPEDYGERARTLLMSGAFFTAADYVLAQQHRRRMIDAIDDVLRDVDILLCANAFDPVPRIDDNAALSHTFWRNARMPFNLTGHPALALMCGVSANGLPISLQMVGRARDEVTVLRAGAAYARAACWDEMHVCPAMQR